jgi:DHA1 family tetracycline resistance protein-like MFS transporter
MKRKLLPAYLLTFVNVLGFSILMPVLPFIVEDFGGEDWMYGLLLTLYSAFQFIGAPYLGALSDERGRKPILMVSQAGTLLAWFVFILALYVPEIGVFGFSLPLLIIALSRILDGITGGNTSVANAYVADITSPDEKKYIFGYLGGIAGIGMILGPGMGGYAASTDLGYLGTLLIAAIISTITLFTIYFFLKESHPPEKRGQSQHHGILYNVLVWRRVKEVDPAPIIKLIFSMKLLFSIMMAFYIATIALFLVDLFDFDTTELGQFMFVVGLFLAFNQAFLSRLFIRKFGMGKTLIIGLFLAFFGVLCITVTDNLYLYIAFYYVMNLGLSLCFPSFNSLISTHADPKKQGEIMGISESINSFAMAVFPVIAAALYGVFGYQIYYFIAALPLVALIMAFSKYRVILDEEKPETEKL